MSVVSDADVNALSLLDAVRPFSQLARGDVAYAGGKGANLGELVRAGLPVPDGFVVGAPAYAAFCEQTGLRERLSGAAERGRCRGHRRTSGRERRRLGAVQRDTHARAAGKGDPRPLRAARWRGSPSAGGCALLGHRRGHSRELVCRDERDLPEHPRRGRGDRRCASLLALVVRRAHDLLPRRKRVPTG